MQGAQGHPPVFPPILPACPHTTPPHLGQAKCLAVWTASPPHFLQSSFMANACVSTESGHLRSQSLPKFGTLLRLARPVLADPHDCHSAASLFDRNIVLRLAAWSSRTRKQRMAQLQCRPNLLALSVWIFGQASHQFCWEQSIFIEKRLTSKSPKAETLPQLGVPSFDAF